MNWVDSLRIALLISLSILFVFMLARRFKQRVMARDLPVPHHAELLALHVLYHPSRLRLEVRMPRAEVLRPALLSADHHTLADWPATEHERGDAVLELPLGDRPPGDYYVELASDSQRTVRRFSLKGE